MGKKENIANAVEAIDFSVRFKTQKGSNGKTEKYAEFTGFTNRDRELNFVEFYNSLDELPGKLRERYDDFDVEEEVMMYLEARRNGLEGVPSLLELLSDVQEEETLLLDLSMAVAAGLLGKLPDPKRSWMEKEYEFDTKLSEAYSNPSSPLTEAAMKELNRIIESIYGKTLQELLRQ